MHPPPGGNIVFRNASSIVNKTGTSRCIGREAEKSRGYCVASTKSEPREERMRSPSTDGVGDAIQLTVIGIE